MRARSAAMSTSLGAQFLFNTMVGFSFPILRHRFGTQVATRASTAPARAPHPHPAEPHRSRGPSPSRPLPPVCHAPVSLSARRPSLASSPPSAPSRLSSSTNTSRRRRAARSSSSRASEAALGSGGATRRRCIKALLPQCRGRCVTARVGGAMWHSEGLFSFNLWRTRGVLPYITVNVMVMENKVSSSSK
eukprot:4239316-Prymnesium_polylepis.1